MAPLLVEKQLELLAEKEDPPSPYFQLLVIAGFVEFHRQSLKWIVKLNDGFTNNTTLKI